MFGLVPADKDMSDELALLKMEIADGYISDNIFDEAIPVLKSALSYAIDKETSSSVSNKLLYCYLSANKNEKAIELIDSLRSVKIIVQYTPNKRLRLYTGWENLKWQYLNLKETVMAIRRLMRLFHWIT